MYFNMLKTEKNIKQVIKNVADKVTDYYFFAEYKYSHISRYNDSNYTLYLDSKSGNSKYYKFDFICDGFILFDEKKFSKCVENSIMNSYKEMKLKSDFACRLGINVEDVQYDDEICICTHLKLDFVALAKYLDSLKGVQYYDKYKEYVLEVTKTLDLDKETVEGSEYKNFIGIFKTYSYFMYCENEKNKSINMYKKYEDLYNEIMNSHQ